MGWTIPVESLKQDQLAQQGAAPPQPGISTDIPTEALKHDTPIRDIPMLEQAGRTFGGAIAPAALRVAEFLGSTLLSGAAAEGMENSEPINPQDVSDAIFRGMDEQIKVSRDYYATKANEEENTPGKVIGGLGAGLATAVVPEVGIGLGAAPTLDMAVDMIQKGYSLTDIAKAGIPHYIIDNAAQLAPFAIGAKLATRAGLSAGASKVAGAASGAVLNPVASAAGRAGENVTSPDEYHQDVKPDLAQLMVEVGSGLGFGYHGAAGARLAEQGRAQGIAEKEDVKRARETIGTPADQMRAVMGQRPGSPDEPQAPPQATGIDVGEAGAPDLEHVDAAPPPHFVEHDPELEEPPKPSARGIDVQEVEPEKVKAAPAPKAEAPGIEPETPEEVQPAPPPKSDKQVELEKLLDLAQTPEAKAVIKTRLAAEEKRIKQENAATELRDLAQHTADPEEAAALLARADKLHPVEKEPPPPATPPSPVVDESAQMQAPAVDKSTEMQGAAGGLERRSKVRPNTGDNPLQPGEEPTISKDKMPEGMAVSPYDPANASDPYRGKFWAELPPEEQQRRIDQFRSERARIQAEAPKNGLDKQPKAEPEKTVSNSPFFRKLMDGLGGIHSDEKSDLGFEEKHTALTLPGKGHIFIGGPGRGRLFHKGGADMDSVVRWMQQEKYLSDRDVENAEATGVGGSHELARELINQEIREPHSVHPIPEQEDRWHSIARVKQRNELLEHAENLGIETRGRTDEDIQHDVWRMEDHAHAAEHGGASADEFMHEHTEAIRQANERDPDAVERAAIQHENDHGAFMRAVKEINDAHDAIAAGERNPGDEPGPGRPDAESEIRGNTETGAAVSDRLNPVRDEPGARAGGSGERAQTGSEVQPAGPDRANEAAAGQAGKPVADAMRAVEPRVDQGAAVAIDKLREQYPGMGKEAFDKMVLDEAQKGNLELQRHAWPAKLKSQAGRKEKLIPDGRGGYFDSAGLRRPPEEPATGKPVEPAHPKFDLHGLSVNDAEKELRGLARPEQKGDVMLSNGDTVPFADAVRLAQEGIESGALKPNPAQLHFGLGLAMRDTARVLDGVREAQHKAGKAASEPFSLENPTPQSLKEREKVKKDAAAGQPPLLSESSPEGWGKAEPDEDKDEMKRVAQVTYADPRGRAAMQAKLDKSVSTIKDWLNRKNLGFTHVTTRYRIEPSMELGARVSLGDDGKPLIEMSPYAMMAHPNFIAQLMLHEHAHIADWMGTLYSDHPDMAVRIGADGRIEPVGRVAKELYKLAAADPQNRDFLQYPMDPKYAKLHADPTKFQSELFAQAVTARHSVGLMEAFEREAPEATRFIDEALAHAADEGSVPSLAHATDVFGLADSFAARRSDGRLPQSSSRSGGTGIVLAHLSESRPSESEPPPEPPKGLSDEAKGAARPLLARVRDMPMTQAANKTLGSVVQEVQRGVAPMALGSERGRAAAKDFANQDRVARQQWGKFHDIIRANYDAADRKRMFDAGEEENQMRLNGETDPKRGLGRLSPEERDTMKVLHDYGENLLQRAKAAGMVDEDAGVPYWVPHMAAMIGADGQVAQVPRGPGKGDGINAGKIEGTNLRTSAESLMQRKHQTIEEAEAAGKKAFGPDFKMVHDILTMPLAMGRLERAIAGRELINRIQEMGKTTGENLVDIHGNSETHFTINHPAFTTYKWKKDSMPVKEAHDQQLWDGLSKVAEALGVTHQRLANLKGRAWGLSYQGGNRVQTKFAGPETVLTHELGHQIDHKYGLIKEMQGTPGVAKELRALADARYASKDPDEVPQHYKKYVREGSEKMANLVHAYVHAPELMDRIAPKAKAKFEAFLDKHPEIGEPLRAVKPGVELGVRSQEIPYRFPQKVPLYVSKEFEGPLRAVLNDGPNGKAYEAAMALKTIAVESIMNSPAIHLSVVLGRTFPAAPGRMLTGRIFMDGSRVVNDPRNTEMREFVQNGMVPIGKFGDRQDITGIMQHVPDDPRQQTWGQAPITKAVAGAIRPFSESASLKTAQGLYKAADFWHNTLLWNQVAKIQAGLAVHSRDQFIKQGFDRQTAVRMAAHLANRYAGAIPNESMSSMARKFLNLEEFSRSFTTGNLGAVKDVLTGLPRDVQSQIARDMGPEARDKAVAAMRRKSLAVFAMDVGLMYLGGSTLQDYFKHKLNPNAPEGIPGAIAGIATGDMHRVHAAMAGYERRAAAEYSRIKDNPMRILNPFAVARNVTPMADNEPGKKDRILVGYGDDGTARYYRFSFGKVGEDFEGWMTHAHDMMVKKESTLIRPTIEAATNNQGFNGSQRPVWDEKAVDENGLPLGVAKIGGQIALHYLQQQLPTDQLSAAKNLMTGKSKFSWQDMDALHAIGPMVGLQFSKGFPGGPAFGEMQEDRKEHSAELTKIAPDLRAALKAGDTVEANKLMDQARMTPAERKWFYRLNQQGASKNAVRSFEKMATPEQQANFQRLQAGQ